MICDREAVGEAAAAACEVAGEEELAAAVVEAAAVKDPPPAVTIPAEVGLVTVLKAVPATAAPSIPAVFD